MQTNLYANNYYILQKVLYEVIILQVAYNYFKDKSVEANIQFLYDKCLFDDITMKMKR